MSVKPKCPKCEAELDLKNDIKWETSGIVKKTFTVYYCGKCGSILSVGIPRTFSNKND